MKKSIGFVRLYVQKLENKEPLNSFDLLEEEHISTELSRPDGHDALEEEIHNVGIGCLFEQSISDILEHYAVGDVIEIIGDAVLEYSKTMTDYGYEYDLHAWLDDEKYRKLTDGESKSYGEEE